MVVPSIKDLYFRKVGNDTLNLRFVNILNTLFVNHRVNGCKFTIIKGQACKHSFVI